MAPLACRRARTGPAVASGIWRACASCAWVNRPWVPVSVVAAARAVASGTTAALGAGAGLAAGGGDAAALAFEGGGLEFHAVLRRCLGRARLPGLGRGLGVDPIEGLHAVPRSSLHLRGVRARRTARSRAIRSRLARPCAAAAAASRRARCCWVCWSGSERFLKRLTTTPPCAVQDAGLRPPWRASSSRGRSRTLHARRSRRSCRACRYSPHPRTSAMCHGPCRSAAW